MTNWTTNEGVKEMRKDQLAAGDKASTSGFGSMTQQHWDAIFMKTEEFISKYRISKEKYWKDDQKNP